MPHPTRRYRMLDNAGFPPQTPTTIARQEETTRHDKAKQKAKQRQSRGKAEAKQRQSRGKAEAKQRQSTRHTRQRLSHPQTLNPEPTLNEQPSTLAIHALDRTLLRRLLG